ncbi:MAG TPA: L-threonylcarbamoyladenylate synthase [Pyrinomonadaceae bacterium]|nr:L-threonylcarbamoyladenylate synthase [Pyrinomonadaceae bacterium]
MVILEDSKPATVQAADIIARGGVIAFRTDTFYGLGADPFNRSAVQRIKALKGGEENKPILVVISELDQVARLLIERSKTFDLLAERFWPGPLTLIGKATPEVPEEIMAGTGTVGLRLPDDEDVRGLIRICGGTLTATSANPSGQQPAKTAQDVENYFASSVDLIVDAGQARTDRPSTVVDVSGATIRVIREGVISGAAVRAALKNVKANS